MKKFIASLGIVVLVFSVMTAKNIKNGENKALSLNDQKTGFGIIAGDIPPCSWNVNPPEKVISENKTEALSIDLTSSKDSECQSILSLRAPGFDFSPSKEEQTVNLAKGSKGSISWILSPQKTGTFDIAVSDMVNTKIFGITVTNMFGLSAVQAKTASFAGTLFGPMLTVPWWWERLRRKQNQDTQKNENVVGK